ncbi:hypothetical protein C2G38_2187868 [Gigaspora rosea]|uniref:Uncharacterized protein n=1 Tax=Gigaspora rosea TaxID=44941 RepID=A0A397V7A4_9GLOM|nr:hypothetical protein C2G38_2187868 [Gigaspora rosea]
MSQLNKRKNQLEENVSDKRIINEEGQIISKNTSEEIDYYVNLKSWKLSNKVDNDAFEFAFPNKDERLTFAKNLLEYYNARVLEIKRIEGVMPKSRKHLLFFKAKTWCEKILKNTKLGATLTVSCLEEYIENLENEIIANEEEQ